MAEDRMLSDEILLGLIKANSGGGGGGTSNYNDLSNKPQIGGVTLSGNKSASDLGLVAAVDGKGLSTNDYTDADKAIVGGVTAALAGKQASLTAGGYIRINDSDEISVKRLVLDGDEYTYEIYSKSTQTHIVVDKYNSNSTLVSTREYYMNDLNPAVAVDGLFTLYLYGGPWTCTLLVASKDHAAGYSFSSPLNVYTHHSETFELPPEESPNDLIIRSELDTALATKADLTDLAPAFSTETAYTVGQYVSYDGNIYKCTSAHSAGAWVAGDFTLVAVGSELESKQNATDNTLQTTDKTVVGAINEHEGDIDSLKSGLTNYQAQNDLNLEVPDRKNLFNKDNADIITSKALNSQTGGVYPSEDWSVTGYIEIEPSTTYTLSTMPNTSNSVAFYDSEKAYISGEGVFETQKTPSNAKYLRFDYKTKDAAIMQLELGSTATAYAPYIPSVESRIETVESGLSGIKSVSKTITLGAVVAGNLVQITINDVSTTPKAIYIKDNSKGFPIIAANFWVSNNVLTIQAYNVSVADRTEGDIECVLIYC